MVILVEYVFFKVERDDDILMWSGRVFRTSVTGG